jgi:RNA polymerase sigma-70 factor (ECF subfamily)
MSLDRETWFREEIFPLERELRGYLRRFFSDQEGKDIVQQCYAQICAMSDYRSIQSPRAFLFVMARNAAVQRIRHDRVVPVELVAELEELDVLASAPSAERVYSAREELHRLGDAVATLPAQCRQVFTLRKVYGFSQKEIAAKLAISEHTVEKHVSKGVRLCAEYLLATEAPEKVIRLQVTQRRWKLKNAKDATKP